MIKAIVIEDDVMVAAINRQYLSAVPDIRIAGVFHNGKEALKYLERHQIDLIILDIYMPGFTGLELLSHLRQSRCPAEVIMVTAANDTESLDIALKMGILDYLVKPFTYERFQTALQRFLEKKHLMQSRNEFSQETIDRMLGQRQVNRECELAKGLQDKTLEKIRTHMRANKGIFHTSEEIAGAAGLSRVTIRRYMNYLIEAGEVVSQVDYQTGGRPSIRYQYIGLGVSGV